MIPETKQNPPIPTARTFWDSRGSVEVDMHPPEHVKADTPANPAPPKAPPRK